MEPPAPSLPTPFAKARLLAGALSNLQAIGDFEIVDLLGEGAFGKVFRARQISLDRQVALKVTANLGDEGRTMARLEHPRIVQVFSETVDEERGLRLLCMQLVAGATLQQVLVQLQRFGHRRWDGQTILQILERSSLEPAILDPASLRDRSELADCLGDEAVCWIGQQLAETLAYAHGQGVLHLDIKPANVLLNQYGQPMLTDFSVSISATVDRRAGTAILGGTLGYMAPEHLATFHPDRPAAPESVDQRSDVYSLGALLLEILLGRKRELSATTIVSDSDRLGVVADTSDLESVDQSLRECDAPPPLAHIVCRCLHANPDQRYQTAGDLSDALGGCRELLRAQRSLPGKGRLTQLAVLHPLRFILLFTILPNLAVSALIIGYIAMLVIPDLAPAQRIAFWQMVVGYNVVIIVVMAVMVERTLLTTARSWRRLQAATLPNDNEVTMVRRRTLALSIWVVVLTCAGWLPFVPVIPIGMEWLAGPIDRGVLWHISVGYLLTGLIAVVCSYFVVSFVVLRSLYARYWRDAAGYRQTVARELARIPRRNRLFQVLAGLTPLAAAGLLMAVGPEQFTVDSFQRFRALLIVLLIAGVGGSWLANWGATRLNQCVEVYLLTLRNN